MSAITTSISEGLERALQLIFKRRATHAGVERPQSVHLEYLRGVSTSTAVKFARSFIRNMHSSGEGWIGTYPFSDGVVVEVQEGGSGHPYWPNLVAAFSAASSKSGAQTYLLEAASARSIIVEFSASGVSCLALPESVPSFDATRVAQSSDAHLAHVPLGSLERMTLGGYLLTGCALLTVPLAISTRPDAPSVEFAEAHRSDIGARELSSLLAPPVGNELSAIRFDGQTWLAEYKPKASFPRPTLILKEVDDASK